jgi:hypothetical protein
LPSPLLRTRDSQPIGSLDDVSIDVQTMLAPPAGDRIPEVLSQRTAVWRKMSGAFQLTDASRDAQRVQLYASDVAALPLLGLRQVGEVRRGKALECHTERRTFSHAPADSLAQRDRRIPGEKLRLCGQALG